MNNAAETGETGDGAQAPARRGEAPAGEPEEHDMTPARATAAARFDLTDPEGRAGAFAAAVMARDWDRAHEIARTTFQTCCRAGRQGKD